jgi:hypothetical protein
VLEGMEGFRKTEAKAKRHLVKRVELATSELELKETEGLNASI